MFAAKTYHPWGMLTEDQVYACDEGSSPDAIWVFTEGIGSLTPVGTARRSFVNVLGGLEFEDVKGGATGSCATLLLVTVKSIGLSAPVKNHVIFTGSQVMGWKSWKAICGLGMILVVGFAVIREESSIRTE